jgi:hypothetical protein
MSRDDAWKRVAELKELLAAEPDPSSDSARSIFKEMAELLIDLATTMEGPVVREGQKVSGGWTKTRNSFVIGLAALLAYKYSSGRGVYDIPPANLRIEDLKGEKRKAAFSLHGAVPFQTAKYRRDSEVKVVKSWLDNIIMNMGKSYPDIDRVMLALGISGATKKAKK